MLGSHLGRDTSYPDTGLSRSSSVPQNKYWDIVLLSLFYIVYCPVIYVKHHFED
jgi:hypothetical protein